MATWLEALKAWNRKKGGKYQIPKKGTKEYDEVRKMMGKSMKGGREAPPRPPPRQQEDIPPPPPGPPPPRVPRPPNAEEERQIQRFREELEERARQQIRAEREHGRQIRQQHGVWPYVMYRLFGREPRQPPRGRGKKRGGMDEPGERDIPPEFPPEAPLAEQPGQRDEDREFIPPPPPRRQQQQQQAPVRPPFYHRWFEPGHPSDEVVMNEIRRRHPNVFREPAENEEQQQHNNDMMDEIYYQYYRKYKKDKKRQRQMEHQREQERQEQERQQEVARIVAREPREPGGDRPPRDMRYWMARIFGRGKKRGGRVANENERQAIQRVQQQLDALRERFHQIPVVREELIRRYNEMMDRAENENEEDQIQENLDRDLAQIEQYIIEYQNQMSILQRELERLRRG